MTTLTRYDLLGLFLLSSYPVRVVISHECRLPNIIVIRLDRQQNGFSIKINSSTNVNRCSKQDKLLINCEKENFVQNALWGRKNKKTLHNVYFKWPIVMLASNVVSEALIISNRWLFKLRQFFPGVFFLGGGDIIWQAKAQNHSKMAKFKRTLMALKDHAHS